MGLQIFIPSRSRFDESRTLDRLAFGDMARQATLVVPHDQAKKYRRLAGTYGCSVVGVREEGIAAVRRRIGELASNKFIMLDDDLRFFVRDPDPDSTRLWQLPKAGYPRLFGAIERALDRYAHVAIGARQGNNNLELPYIECSRPLRALAYRRKEFLACEHERVAIMEDFDVTLQLLRKGYKNCVFTRYAQDHIATQLPGGCSDYRTLKLHNQNVKKLRDLHPKFVSIRVKENRSIGGLLTRLEATIHWKKAWESSQ